MKTHGKTSADDKRCGAILGVVLVVVAVVSVIGVGLMELATRDAEEASRALLNARAFWDAEAGVQRVVKRLYDGIGGDVATTSLGTGYYEVTLDDPAYPTEAVSRGQAGGAERYIRVNLSHLSDPYEEAIFAANERGMEWVLDLGGEGDPNHKDVGGKDMIYGDIYVNGDFAMVGESQVYAAPPPNTYGLDGDVEATGSIAVGPDADIAGSQTPNASPRGMPDLVGMNYGENNTHNISAIFDALGIESGHLPDDHPLHDVVVKNPPNRAGECAKTPGDDFFFEPEHAASSGGPKEANTPLDLGDQRVYYVEGDVWFHGYGTTGFKVDGQATIVATGDMHISSNIKYKDGGSLLGLVALGEYDAVGHLDSGGDIFFGDPQFQTLYTVDAFMFAGNDFLYNTVEKGGGQSEPRSGFQVFGNFAAIGQVVVYRDWYKPQGAGERQPAVYNHAEGKWQDALTGQDLVEKEVASLNHYQMIVTYDERIRDIDTQPPRLPHGPGTIFGGVSHWEEINEGDA